MTIQPAAADDEADVVEAPLPVHVVSVGKPFVGDDHAGPRIRVGPGHAAGAVDQDAVHGKAHPAAEGRQEIDVGRGRAESIVTGSRPPGPPETRTSPESNWRCSAQSVKLISPSMPSTSWLICQL
jgi:hypothetical protein